MITLSLTISLLSSCFTLTADPRALVLQPDGGIRALLLVCPRTPVTQDVAAAAPAAALDPQSIRLMTWNIHKEGDSGWQEDLTALAKTSDIVLLQETTLQPAIGEVLKAADLRWVMASSFTYDAYDIGVLTAAHAAPIASCTQRVFEPFLRLPKSAVISWFALAGSAQTLAVVNVHAINFTLSLDAYRAQLTALAEVLATHDGPIVLAGDFNTWSPARMSVLSEVAIRLGLTEVKFTHDVRALFLGTPVDHILVRELHVVASASIEVTSSDHNPVTATLQWVGR